MNVSWTDEQLEAITEPGDLLLAASAGTGKTTTIVGKILWSLGRPVGGRPIRGERIPPPADRCALDRLAAITFTEKAAHDLQAKLRGAVLGGTAPPDDLRWELERATIGTIHAFAADLLREHALRLGLDPTFRILDARETELQQGEIVREVLSDALAERDPGAVALTRRYGLEGWKMAPGAADRIRDVMRDLRWRARRFDAWSRPAEDATQTRELDLAALVERARLAGCWGDREEERGRDEDALAHADTLYRLGRTSVGAWLSWLERENARDFDSLILDARRLLTRDETRSALEAIRGRYRLLVIDEFQDTDRAQWDIARSILGVDEMEPPSPRERPQLVLVGDPKQSIYRFRGADVGVWNEARDLFERIGSVLELSRNFRSEPALVAYVNRVGERDLSETTAPLRATAPETAIEYRPLREARAPTAAAGLEWLVLKAATTGDRREEEGRRVAGRIHELLGAAPVLEAGPGGRIRRCRPGDIAVLARRNDDLSALEPALRAYGIPFYNSASTGLADRQEVLDLVTALRLIENPLDDLRAFAYLRSPFVGLRDEVLVRIALCGTSEGSEGGRAWRDRSLLERAERYLALVEEDPSLWYAAPEGEEVDLTECEALASGIGAIREAAALADRADPSELLAELVDRTGYGLHLLLCEGASESLANIERFLALLQEYRHLPLVRFLALWDRWGEKDPGIPQARLFSSADDVVTLSTIHAAKGLEWPVVFLVGTGTSIAGVRRLVGAHWADPALGPVLLPVAAERGPRAEAALERRLDQDRAEEARLLYVAVTRARDRLVIVGPAEPPADTFADWLGVALDEAVEAHRAGDGAEVGPDGENGRRPVRAVAHDLVTGTGGQLDAFGDGDGLPQLDLFAAPAPEPGESVHVGTPMVLRRGGASVQASLAPPPIGLDWLRGIERVSEPCRIERVVPSELRSLTSATERMMRARDPEAWALRYRHGVLPPGVFLPSPADDEPLPAAVRGTLIHGVLERIRAAEELEEVLEETLASLDLGELEVALQPGSRYRAALEAEIERVVRSPEWSWYVEGITFRELDFLHRSPEGWVRGTLDLLRPAAAGAAPEAQVSLFEAGDAGVARRSPWVIDFKTHRIEAGDAPVISGQYGIQSSIYRAAADALAGGPEGARVALHFTHPNVAIELPAGPP